MSTARPCMICSVRKDVLDGTVVKNEEFEIVQMLMLRDSILYILERSRVP